LHLSGLPGHSKKLKRPNLAIIRKAKYSKMKKKSPSFEKELK